MTKNPESKIAHHVRVPVLGALRDAPNFAGHSHFRSSDRHCFDAMLAMSSEAILLVLARPIVPGF
jgi:hypothetical protein